SIDNGGERFVCSCPLQPLQSRCATVQRQSPDLRTARKQLTAFPERCNQTVSLQHFQGAANTLSAPSTKRALIFAVPATVLVAAYLLLSRMGALSPARQEVLLVAPYLVSVVG